jgi:hypothetical protein
MTRVRKPNHPCYAGPVSTRLVTWPHRPILLIATATVSVTVALWLVYIVAAQLAAGNPIRALASCLAR